jgi:hypothetical protein
MLAARPDETGGRDNPSRRTGVSRTTFKDHLRYRFDNFMARGTGALIGGMAVLSLVIIAIAAAVIALTGVAQEGETQALIFWEAAWQSMMRTLDAGTMGGDTGWGFRIVMFVVTVGSVFVNSSLIGVLGTGVEGKMESLRKGRSRVPSTDTPRPSAGRPTSSR